MINFFQQCPLLHAKRLPNPPMVLCKNDNVILGIAFKKKERYLLLNYSNKSVLD